MMKGFDRQQERFREGQRSRSLADLTAFQQPASAIQEEVLPATQFTGMPVMKHVSRSDYLNLFQFINKRIRPGRELKDPILQIMVNLFLSHSSYHKKGRSPSKSLKNYTKEQLEVFQNELSFLTIHTARAYKTRTLGSFENIQNQAIKDSLELRANPDLITGEFDILYLIEPRRMIPNPNFIEGYEGEREYLDSQLQLEKREKAFWEFNKGVSKEDQAGLEDYIKGIKEEPTLNFSEDEQVDWLFGKPEVIIPKLVVWLKEGDNVPPRYMEMLVAMGDYLSIARDIKKFIANAPKIPEIAQRVSQNLSKNGILLLEAKEQVEIPNMRFVHEYGSVFMYQK